MNQLSHYLDIRLLPDPEFETQDLLNALFAKFHRAMNQTVAGQIGVSFPEVEKRLGAVLRLHGSEAALTLLMGDNWLKGMKDYCQISPIAPIPEQIQYRTVRRVQIKSVHNKRKRSIAKGWLTPEQALESIPDSQQKPISLPYIEMKSLSNLNRMRVYIEHGELQNQPSDGTFNSYGLSATATIPWF